MAQAPLAVVVLAAGEGSRMKSKRHKVLHEAAGRPLLEHILRATEPLEPQHIVVVVGFSGDSVRERFKDSGAVFVTQDFDTGYGTGHALMQAESALDGFQGDVLVLNGDGPLLKTETLQRLRDKQQSTQAGMTLITCEFSNPTGMGRVVRDSSGRFREIVEQKDASQGQLELREVNPGVYIFDESVFKKAKSLKNDNASNEYYITDLPSLYLAANSTVNTLSIEDETEVLGVNTREDLARIEQILRERINKKWLEAGVTLVAPEQTFIDDTVELGQDVVLEQGVTLKGKTQIGVDAHIGAYAHLTDCSVEAGAEVGAHKVESGSKIKGQKEVLSS